MTKCFTRSKILIAIFIVLLCVEIPSQAYAGTPAENVRVLFLIDDSGSMADNDRAALRYTAIRLFVSALDEGDHVGVIRFATNSTPMLPAITPITNSHTKTEIIEFIQPISPEGYTDMLQAFILAGSLMDDNGLGDTRTVVILLTDGRPEIGTPYASYERDTIQAAINLGVPIYTVALTPYSQTNFLRELTQETQGKVIPAQTADNLLDSFLQILGELKDRTIMKADQRAEDGSIHVWLPPTLVPYVSKVTFVASQPNHRDIRLINPYGTVVEEDHTNVTFRLVDEHFTAITIDTPPGGEWAFQFANQDPAQVHAILHSRLRARADSPGGLHPQGAPMLISASLYEEMDTGHKTKIIGEASFSAEIHLPDGSVESLDTFYDDGTHGDRVPGDGSYSRLYPNPALEGVYKIIIEGVKGVVPVQSSTSVEFIHIPGLEAVQPKNQTYAIRTTPIPLDVVLRGEFKPELLEGGMLALVTAPSGKIKHLDLIYDGAGAFEGTYLPQEDGAYTVEYYPHGLYYRGLPITEKAAIEFSTLLIGMLVFQEPKIGILDQESDGLTRMETPSPGEMIPVQIGLVSHTSRISTVRVHLENLPGFTIHNNFPIEVPPNSPYQQTIYLETSTTLQPGAWKGNLVFTTTDDVDLVNAQVPLEFEFITPMLTIERATQSYAASCQLRQTYSVTLTIHSSSLVDEKLQVSLGPPDLQEVATFTVSTGRQEFHFEMNTKSTFLSREEVIQLQVKPGRPELRTSPSHSQTIAVTIPGILQTCRRPIIFLGLGLLVAGIITARMAKTIHQRSKPPIVSGTLIHWLAESPQMEYQVNLTEIEKTEVKIGRGSSCDVVLPHVSVADEHLAILAEPGGAGEVRLAILPNEPIMRGYQTYTSSLPLEEHSIYQVGDCHFKFIPALEF